MPSPFASLRCASAVAVAVLSAGCVGTELPPSLWPPDNFVLELEEVRFAAGRAEVLRRFRVDAAGLAVYGESQQPLLLPGSDVSLPVFDRLAVYRLERDCVRALARRVSRIGAAEKSFDPGVPATAEIGLLVRWQAFDDRKKLTGAGRLHGALGEVVALVAAHLPSGVQLQAELGRKVVPVLRSVPEVAESAGGALLAYRQLREQGRREPAFLLEGLALACRQGERDDASQWLEAWIAATASERVATSAFRDKDLSLQPAQLRQLLPPESPVTGGA